MKPAVTIAAATRRAEGLKRRYVVTCRTNDPYHEMLELDPDDKGFTPYVANRFLKVSPSAGPNYMKTLELKVPPLPLAAGFGVLMWAVDLWLPLHAGRALARTVVALATLGLAVTIVVSAVIGFRRARTTVDPFHPETASNIVTTGIYRVTRNPMYLGFLLALIALAVFLGNVVSAVLPPIFVVYMNRFQIEPEERALLARFGAPYEAYLRTVRRWI
jgi:protein-S-isoprenylcysteine O-methyltransferase Ste14